MQTTKISTYINFAIRANKIIRGADAITAKKRRYPLIIVCNTAADRLKHDIADFAGEATPVLTVENLAELSHIEGCRALAITEKELAKAILAEAAKQD